MSTLSDALAAMDKATPGPWAAYIGEEINGILDAGGKHLAELWMRKSYDNKANAAVIAAAPDALAWIKKALPWLEEHRVYLDSQICSKPKCFICQKSRDKLIEIDPLS